MALTDTSPEAARVQAAALARLPDGERLMRAFELSEMAREMSRSGIRYRNPRYTETEIHLALFRLMYGDELFTKVWPASPLLES